MDFGLLRPLFRDEQSGVKGVYDFYYRGDSASDQSCVLRLFHSDVSDGLLLELLIISYDTS